MRTAIDYSWFGESRAQKNCNLTNNFWLKKGIPNIHDGYKITGQETSPWHNSAVVSTQAASSMTFTNNAAFAK